MIRNRAEKDGEEKIPRITRKGGRYRTKPRPKYDGRYDAKLTFAIQRVYAGYMSIKTTVDVKRLFI